MNTKLAQLPGGLSRQECVDRLGKKLIKLCEVFDEAGFGPAEMIALNVRLMELAVDGDDSTVALMHAANVGLETITLRLHDMHREREGRGNDAGGPGPRLI